MANVAINGLGRIGRAAFKILLDVPDLELTAVNDLIPEDNLAYLLNHDTVYGGYQERVSHEQGALKVGNRSIHVYHEKEPADLPWKKHHVDLVFECTGVFRKKPDLQKHLEAGARYVLLSAPAKSEGVQMVVHGINRAGEEARVVSCASCTTNCITPVAEILDRRLGVRKAVMTTIHAYTSSQSLVDGPRNKWRRGRAAAANFVPTSTGAAKATTSILPQLAEKFDGVAVRGPVPYGSLADIVLLTARSTSVDEVNGIFKQEAESDRYDGILGVTADPIVSSDVIRDPRASIVDLTMTQVVDGELVKVMSWYDNEWGYTAQMVREALRLLKEAPKDQPR
jgi:glyceraldehyde 3-phosphate dehydrogenase